MERYWKLSRVRNVVLAYIFPLSGRVTKDDDVQPRDLAERLMAICIDFLICAPILFIVEFVRQLFFEGPTDIHNAGVIIERESIIMLPATLALVLVVHFFDIYRHPPYED